ncbi:MAG: DUF2062 domain-containing protein [Planctomycetota bacterium]
MSSHFRNRGRRIWRKLLGTGDPPERVARGLAAGIFAAAFPLPGIHVPLCLVFAWLVRANKAAALAGQAVSNAATLLPLACLQFRIGSLLWPGEAAAGERALALLRKVNEDYWAWGAPLASLDKIGPALASAGVAVLGPLALGVLVTGVAAAVCSYAVSLTALTVFYGYRLRRRIERGLGPQVLHGHFAVPESGAAEAPDRAAVMRYAMAKAHVVAPSVKLLTDGKQAYPEMLAAIEGAEKSVDLETYILRADSIGRQFAAALCGAAARGVTVRLLYDGVGCLGLPEEYTAGLLSAGVKVAVYRPLHLLWFTHIGSMNRRDHRKILVVDENTAFTGGLNIGDEYAANESGGAGWRDTHCRIDCPETARQLRALIELAWRRAEQLTPPPKAHEPPAVKRISAGGATGRGECAATSADVPVWVLSNKDLLKRIQVRQTYLRAIRRAQRYILIENAYFIPDRRIRRALRNAVKRGVAVGVVVPMYSDLRIVALASRALYSELLASGVRLFEYPVNMLHCKAAVIDDVWLVVSSYNLDHRSLLHNLEAGVLMLDRRLAQAMRTQILGDIARCKEVTLELHTARSWHQALAEALAYQLRYWL